MRCSVLPPQSNFIRKATVCLLSFIPICAESEAVGMVICMGRQKKEPKPENSKTVSQWGRLGRIPIDPLKTRYIWDNYYGVPQSVYYLEDNTREMTDDERADFQADRKAYRLRYMKFITEELERRRRGEKDGGSAGGFGSVEGTLSEKK